MSETKKKDKCVSCWKDTIYDNDLPINLRKHYVESVGQLCEKCYSEIYEIEEEINFIESHDILPKNKH